MEWYRLDSSGSVYRPVAGSCEHRNEPSGSINVGKFMSSWAAGGFSRRTRLHATARLSITALVLGVNYRGYIRRSVLPSWLLIITESSSSQHHEQYKTRTNKRIAQSLRPRVLRNRGLDFRRGKRLFSSPQRPERFWGVLSFLSNGFLWTSSLKSDHSPPSSAKVTRGASS
jgi:hypothetical protein